MYLSKEAVRNREFFGFDWQFLLEEGEYSGLTAQSAEALGGGAWRPVQVPHDWSIDYPVDEGNPSCGSGGYFRTGVGWYKKIFALPDSVKGKHLSLLFDGVYMNCTITLNGKEVGRHIYGYTSFEVDITDAATAGDNLLLVKVDNSMQPNSRWYTGSGITRDVWLCAAGEARIPLWGVYVTTPEVSKERARVDVRTSVAAAGKALRLETAVLDAAGVQAARCASSASDECVQSLSVENPALWSHETPTLYSLRSRLYEGDALVDEVITPFGIRGILFDKDKGFFLNGAHVKLNGVCVHHDGGCVGAAVPPEIWRRRMMKLKAMGCNAIRCSHNPPDPALLDLCDELGFLVMDEAFDEWRELKGKEFGSNTHESRGYSEWFDQCYKEDITGMLRRDRNHPSIVIWSIGNEVPEQKTAKGAELARELADICHIYDPTRPITQANDQIRAEPNPAREDFLDALDVVGYNYVDRWRERSEILYAIDKQQHPNWTMLGTEHTSIGGRRGEYPLEGGGLWFRRAYAGRPLKAEKLMKFTQMHDYVAGDFMWTGIDHLGECHWPDKGSSSGVIDTCGYEKDGYYFYQSQWTKEPMLHLLPHWNIDVEPGRVIPVLCYTNCEVVELFVDGKSYGRKCYEFPAQGMSLTWSHFERPIAPITTNDLHLSWDVPFGAGIVEAVGFVGDKEVLRKTLRTAGAPHHLSATCDVDSLPCDGRSVAQVEISVLDENGAVVPDADVDIIVDVQGAAHLLGLDSGRPDEHALYADAARKTLAGLAFAVVRSGREAGKCAITLTADGLAPVALEIDVRA